MKSVSIGRILILMVVFSLPITILQTLFFSEKRWFSTAYPENHYPSANAVPDPPNPPPPPDNPLPPFHSPPTNADEYSYLPLLRYSYDGRVASSRKGLALGGSNLYPHDYRYFNVSWVYNWHYQPDKNDESSPMALYTDTLH